ncbi:MAG: cation transporter [Blautia sp.]|nr:cation transporter [Blautia sp.]
MNIILAAVLTVLIGWAVYRTVLRSRRGGGCCGEHEAAEKKKSVGDKNAANYPFTTKLTIGGMTCENCARKVENSLNSLKDTWGTVKISDHTAVVRTKSEPDEEKIREAVRKAGYVVTGYYGS